MLLHDQVLDSLQLLRLQPWTQFFLENKIRQKVVFQTKTISELLQHHKDDSMLWIDQLEHTELSTSESFTKSFSGPRKCYFSGNHTLQYFQKLWEYHRQTSFKAAQSNRNNQPSYATVWKDRKTAVWKFSLPKGPQANVKSNKPLHKGTARFTDHSTTRRPSKSEHKCKCLQIPDRWTLNLVYFTRQISLLAASA